MHKVSSTYTNERKNPIRNKQYLTYSVGVINQQAQANADISDNEPQPKLSNNNIFGSTKRSFTYATLEQDFTKANGEFLVVPEISASNIPNGYVSNSLFSDGNQFLYIDFSSVLEGESTLNIKGLTIKFHDTCFPTAFNVVTNAETYSVTDNAASEWSTEYGFNGVTWIKIVPVSYRNDNLRLRIEHITFGTGLVFANNKIKTATLKQYISPIADALPQVDFSITIDNSDNKFDTEDSDSALNYMEEGQSGEVYYGRELDDGTTETFKIATVKLSKWDADDKQAKFTSTDILGFLDGTYYKGNVNSTAVTLFALAQDVCTDAGLDSSQYYIDPYLKSITTKNPLPIAKHKECLQYIANAARANLKIDADGRIAIIGAYLPDAALYYNEGFDVYNGSVSNLLDSTANNIRYATFDYNNIKANGERLVIPDDGDFGGNKPCAVSTYFSSSGGTFTTSPKVIYTFDSRCTINGLTITFGTDDYCYPTEFKIVTTSQSDSGATSSAVYVYNLDGSTGEFEVTDKFEDIIRLSVQITKMPYAYVRARVNHISLGEVTNYVVGYEEMTSCPKTSNADKVKSVTVNYYTYSEGTTEEEIASVTANVSSSGQTIGPITWSDPSRITECILYDAIGNELKTWSYTIDTEMSGCCAAYVYVQTIDTAQDVTVKIIGKKYTVSSIPNTTTINTSGSVKTLNNPLIDDQEQASNVLEWLCLYYAADKDYSISYRGAPEIEAHDTIFADMRGNEKPTMIKVYQSDITFSGGLKGTLKARRQLDARTENVDS